MPSIAVIGVAHPHVEYVLGELTSLAGEYTVIGVQDEVRSEDVDVELVARDVGVLGRHRRES
jgi:hypothetical protein